MFSLFRPTEGAIVELLNAARSAPYAYREVGATQGVAPRGYDSDRLRVCLGRGAETYERAKQAIRNWRMFPAEMTEILWPETAIIANSVVGVLFRAAGLWSLNACRIVYIVDETDEHAERFGFAYGTLRGHLERGEERFLVEHRRDDDTVWYDLACFSRPGHWLSRLGYPIVRRQQRRFRELSAKSMQKAVANIAPAEITAPCAP